MKTMPELPQNWELLCYDMIQLSQLDTFFFNITFIPLCIRKDCFFVAVVVVNNAGWHIIDTWNEWMNEIWVAYGGFEFNAHADGRNRQ